MRILHVVHQYPPDDVGGTELYTQTLADWQAAQGHHTAVFTPSPQPPTDPALNQAHENGVQVYRLKLGPESRTRVFWRTFGQSQVMAGFTAVLDQEQPDLIHIQHLMGLPAGLVDVIIRAGIPYVVTLHDYWYLCANAQLLTNYDQTICEGPDWWLNCARCALARAGHPQAVAAVPALAPLLALRQQKLQRVLKQARAIITPANLRPDCMRETAVPHKKSTSCPTALSCRRSFPAAQTRPIPSASLTSAVFPGKKASMSPWKHSPACPHRPNFGWPATWKPTRLTAPNYKPWQRPAFPFSEN
ncbi:MAG: glycosyltransferase [Chloroflexi bacterium]|nr:glycosyltransferase [Chloroflexota bacterium]